MSTESSPRRVAVVTGSRADYGLLRGVMTALAARADIDLRTLVTGMHLAAEFGGSWKAIAADGFVISARIDIGLGVDSRAAVAHSTGRGVAAFADAFEAEPPDLVLVLGDRYEIFAAATASLLMGIPIAHVHGGEITEGAFDDAIRHAISKMAHLHFAATEPYRRRLIQMGEDPERVFTVGAPGLDLLMEQTPVDRAQVLRLLGMEQQSRFLLVTLHPETMNPSGNAPMVEAMLEALDAFGDHGVVFTGVNADPGNRVIDAAVRAFVNERPDRTRWTVSLGSALYGQALLQANAVIGNSSSGIIEAPALGTPTVNIGQRQRGRLRAASIIDCPPDRRSIAEAIARAISPAFRADIKRLELPYGRGGASRRIADILAAVDLGALGPKGFHDY